MIEEKMIEEKMIKHNFGKTIHNPLCMHPSSLSKRKNNPLNVEDYSSYPMIYFKDSVGEYLVMSQGYYLQVRCCNTGDLLGLKLCIEEELSKVYISNVCVFEDKATKDVIIIASDSSMMVNEWNWNEYNDDSSLVGNDDVILYPSRRVKIFEKPREEINSIVQVGCIDKESFFLLVALKNPQNETFVLYRFALNKLEELNILKGDRDHYFSAIIIASNEKIIVSTCNNVLIMNGENTEELYFGKEKISAIALEPTSKTEIAIGFTNGLIWMYSHLFSSTNKKIQRNRQFHWHIHPVQTICFIDESTFISGGEESVIVFWDSMGSIRPKNTIARICGGPSGILKIVCNATSENMYVLGADNTLSNYCTFNYECIWKVTGIGIALGEHLESNESQFFSC